MHMQLTHPIPSYADISWVKKSGRVSNRYHWNGPMENPTAIHTANALNDQHYQTSSSTCCWKYMQNTAWSHSHGDHSPGTVKFPRHFPDSSRHSYSNSSYPHHISVNTSRLFVNFLTFPWQRSSSMTFPAFSRQLVTLNNRRTAQSSVLQHWMALACKRNSTPAAISVLHGLL